MIKKRDGLFLSLRSKIILIFFVLIITPFLISGLVTYNKYTSSVKENTKTSSKQLISQVSLNMDKYFEEIGRLTGLPLYDQKIISILNNHVTLKNTQQYLPLSEINTMNLFLFSNAFSRSEIRGVFMLTNEGAIFSSLDQESYKNYDENNRKFINLVGKNRNSIIIPPHLPEYYLNNTEMLFSVVRGVWDPYDDKFLGVIKIDLTQKVYEKAISKLNTTKESKLIITDQEDNVFFSSEEIGDKFEIPQNDQIKIKNINYITSVITSESTNLNIILLTDVQALNKDGIEMINFSMGISIISLFVAIIMAIFLSNLVVKPVKHLQTKMKLVQTGNFDERATVFSHDEMGGLSEGFNLMVSEINRLVKEVYETNLRERDAELSALQSQINPHFLYNTFELISMIAMDNGQFEICDIISCLGRLLRYTVDRKQKPVILKEEVLFIKAYMKIITSRYGERIKTEIIVDPYVEYCLVPKLIIQPLVENAIQHGINEDKGTIIIKIERNKDLLIISVNDDGKGIDPMVLEDLEKKIYGEESYNEDMETFGTEKRGFALRNLHLRLKLLYGNSYGLFIDNTLKHGCTFILKLPMIFTNTREVKN